MSYKTPNDSEDSEVSMHSDASDSPKGRKQKKSRPALKEYFSKQSDSSDHGITSSQNKSYTESLLRKRFKRLINKSEIVQSPKVTFINAPNHSGSDDENSVQTIFPEKISQVVAGLDNDKKEKTQHEFEDQLINEQGDIEPAIDALEEIHPILPEPTIHTPTPANDFGLGCKPKQWFSINLRYVLLVMFSLVLLCSIFFGAPLYFITLVIGMMAPICINIISAKLVDIIKVKLYIKGEGPEKSKFCVPNYADMNILEIPSVDELQVPRIYEGWINLYPHTAYDPETYHLSDTIPVYIKIKDCYLSVHHTKSRIPKRSIYNEPELKLNPTTCLKYNLKNAKISLLPEGLAKIRCWSKKYPICIDIDDNKNDEVFTNVTLPIENMLPNAAEKEAFKDHFQEFTTNNFKENILQDDEFKDVEDDSSTCVRTSTSTLGEDLDLNLVDQEESSEREGIRRIILFARGNREKYDWYVRLLSTINLFSSNASDKEQLNKAEYVKSREEHITEVIFSESLHNDTNSNDNIKVESVMSSVVESKASNNKSNDFELVNSEEEHGLEFRSHQSLMGDPQYLKYMGHFMQTDHKEDVIDIWKDFNFSVSNDVLWFNVLAGRILLGILNDPGWIMKIQERIQKKLSTIKLPYFIDELECSELSLGETPPMIHRASRPIMDERGLWVDLDVTYEGLITLVLSTKLNLMKLKRLNADVIDSGDALHQGNKANINQKTTSAVYNSDLEDSADSSTSDEQTQDASIQEKNVTIGTTLPSPTPRRQSNKSFLKVVDQVAASKFFQHATENKFVKKALVAVSNSQFRLQLNFRGLVGQLVLNIPHPPSDRLWFAFRKPPRIWLSVHPAFGERNVTLTYVTNWIEKKICQEIIKNLVLPNMEDLIIPVLVPQS